MKQRIRSLFILLAFSLALSACSINLPGLSQPSNAEIHGNQLIVAKNYSLPPGNRIEGDIVAIGSNVILLPGSLIQGNVLLIGSSLESRSIIDGDLNLIAGNVNLRDGSILNGDVNQLFNHVIIDKKALVNGTINTISFPGAPTNQVAGLFTFITERLNPQNWLVTAIARTIVHSLLALLSGVFLKKRMTLMVRQVQSQPLITWGAGLLVFGIVPILAILFIITICLSPLGLIVLIVLALLFLTGWIVLGITSGAILQKWLNVHWAFELQAFIGALLLGFASILVGRIPCLGWTIDILVGCIGLGAVIITRFGAQSDRSSSNLP